MASFMWIWYMIYVKSTIYVHCVDIKRIQQYLKRKISVRPYSWYIYKHMYMYMHIRTYRDTISSIYTPVYGVWDTWTWTWICNSCACICVCMGMCMMCIRNQYSKKWWGKGELVSMVYPGWFNRKGWQELVAIRGSLLWSLRVRPED